MGEWAACTFPRKVDDPHARGTELTSWLSAVVSVLNRSRGCS